MNINWITPKVGRITEKNIIARVSMHKAGPKGGSKKQVSITFYPDMMKKHRLMCGDRVLVGFTDGFDAIAIKRVNTGGYALSPTGGKEQREKHYGKASTAVIKIFSPAGVNSVHAKNYTSEDVITDDDVILLPISHD